MKRRSASKILCGTAKQNNHDISFYTYSGMSFKCDNSKGFGKVGKNAKNQPFHTLLIGEEHGTKPQETILHVKLLFWLQIYCSLLCFGPELCKTVKSSGNLEIRVNGEGTYLSYLLLLLCYLMNTPRIGFYHYSQKELHCVLSQETAHIYYLGTAPFPCELFSKLLNMSMRAAALPQRSHLSSMEPFCQLSRFC